MSHAESLDRLEATVLTRIARHREASADRASLSAGTLLVLAALTGGLIIGFSRSHVPSPSRGAESVVLADSARMAPSGLLASSQ